MLYWMRIYHYCFQHDIKLRAVKFDVTYQFNNVPTIIGVLLSLTYPPLLLAFVHYTHRGRHMPCSGVHILLQATSVGEFKLSNGPTTVK